MKSFLVLLSLTLLSFQANAALINSKLEKRHQAMILREVLAKCGFGQAKVIELETKVTEIRIDQGIIDYEYVTELEVLHKFEQNIYDIYRVQVVSFFYSGYNHQEQDWGTYEVQTVGDCRLQ